MKKVFSSALLIILIGSVGIRKGISTASENRFKGKEAIATDINDYTSQTFFDWRGWRRSRRVLCL